MRFTVAALVLWAVTAWPSDWRAIAPGMELGEFFVPGASGIDSSHITILRVDPDLWDLEIASVGDGREPVHSQTAKQWSQSHNFVATINAGMYATDLKTHIGFLRNRGDVHNSRVNHYRSVAAFNPRHQGIPRFRIFDLDKPGVSITGITADYDSVVQNLRLIKRPGENRWRQHDKMWSEAALGEDKAGRILFIFSRIPLSMLALNQALLNLDINVLCAQHLEGGPEAQFYVRVGETELAFTGSYETSSPQHDNNTVAWPIPHVLGLRARPSSIMQTSSLPPSR